MPGNRFRYTYKGRASKKPQTVNKDIYGIHHSNFSLLRCGRSDSTGKSAVKAPPNTDSLAGKPCTTAAAMNTPSRIAVAKMRIMGNLIVSKLKAMSAMNNTNMPKVAPDPLEYTWHRPCIPAPMLLV